MFPFFATPSRSRSYSFLVLTIFLTLLSQDVPPAPNRQPILRILCSVNLQEPDHHLR